MKEVQDQYRNVYLIEKRSDNTSTELRNTFPGRKICVCDFYVNGSERGELDQRGVIYYDGLLIIDHHAPIDYMKRRISSTVIANQFVTANGPLNDDWVIVINHTDTDSLLSALIMRGELEPSERYGQAAIAADHTGEEDVISDVLQAYEYERRIENSVEVVKRVLTNRLKVRSSLRKLAESDQFKWIDGIAYIVLEEKIDAGLVPAILPEAKVIVVASPMPPGSKGSWRVRVRLGLKAKGIALNEMDLPDFGGRWNAGSTTRHGGTNVEPEEYVRLIQDRLSS